MKQFIVSPIGTIKNDGGEVLIILDSHYKKALKELDGFSHIDVIWWFSELDDKESRNRLEELSPYKGSPETMGTFATRSPMRPNPIAISVANILYIDHEKGVIHITYIDANDNTPVLDIKPYTPSLERIENPVVPNWCKHWPKSVEQSANFDWESQFNF